MGNFQLFDGLFEPLVDLVRCRPAVAFVPLTIRWLGVGDTQKVEEAILLSDRVFVMELVNGKTVTIW